MKYKWKGNGFRAVLGLMVLVLAVSTLTALAQDEGLEKQPQIDQAPVVMSQILEGNAIQTTVRINVGQDTYITSNQPDKNYCNTTWLRLGYNKTPGENYGAERTFLWFDLSSIPSDAAINSAQYWIYMNMATPPGDSTMRIESRHLLNSWNQCSVTWNSHQPQWGPVYGSSWVGTNTGWLSGDVTNLVRDWVYGTHANYGVLLMGDETPRERQRTFFSSRDPGQRIPYLIVDYTQHVDNEPPVVSVNSLPTWSPQQFEVGWSGHDPGGSGIAYYDVQYQVYGQNWIDWLMHTQSTSAEFVGGANSTTYGFRTRGVDNAGNVQPWSTNAQATTTVDSVAPYATVDPLAPITFETAFTVYWSGSDNTGGSGIAFYDVQYQADGGPWLYWQTGTSATSALATGAENGVTYGLRARAVDRAGNHQPWSSIAQAQTTINTEGPIATILPINLPSRDVTEFMVYWEGESSDATPIKYYDVRWAFRDGPWNAWLPQTTKTQDLFAQVRTDVDGSYCFEVQATDTADRKSGFMGKQCFYVDRLPPYLEAVAYGPAIYRDSAGGD